MQALVVYQTQFIKLTNNTTTYENEKKLILLSHHCHLPSHHCSLGYLSVRGTALPRRLPSFSHDVGHPSCTRIWCRSRHQTHSLLAEAIAHLLPFALLPADGVSPCNPMVFPLHWTQPKNPPVFLRAIVWSESRYENTWGNKTEQERKLDTHLPVEIVAFDEFPFSGLPAISLLGRVHCFPINNWNGMAMDVQEWEATPVLCAIIPHPIQYREILFDVPRKRNWRRSR